MATRAKLAAAKPGQFVDRDQRQRGEDNRPSAARRGYGSKWRKESREWLDRNPVCVACKRQGRTLAAKAVDHIEPHRGNQELFWRRSNWQSLCIPCHNRKSRSERLT